MTLRTFIPEMCAPAVRRGAWRGITRTALLLAAIFATTVGIASAQSNPGDPLFCQPNEGNSFLIVNGGSGIFTVDPDCYNGNIVNNTQPTITTSQHGTLTRNTIGGSGNYVYTPPTPNFTGLDTFTINVTTGME